MGLVCLVAALPQLDATADTMDTPEVRYPLRAYYLTPGFMRGPRRMKSSSTTRSFAVVGTERLSIEWLRANRDRLKEKNAMVLVVSAFDKEEFAAVVAAAPGLMVMLMPGDEAIHDAMGIEVYPVLIDAEKGEIRQ